MTESDKILIDSLSCYMNDRPFFAEFDKSTADALIIRSREQKVLPIVFLKNRETFQKALEPQTFLKLKTEVLFGTSAQIQRSAELVRIFDILKNNGIDSIVFKGAVCRAMYASPEYRISSDEDLLISRSDIEKASQLLLENGYRLLDSKNGEMKLANNVLNSIVELHSSLIDESGAEKFAEIGKIFTSQINNSMMLDIGCGKICTFQPTYGFLSLCIHFFNHFVRGGIGIRPVMDIACFIKNYGNEIDFEQCFSILSGINADVLILTVISLCKKYFGISCDYSGNEKAVDDLLGDIMGAGVYGTADESRVHGASVTRSLARENGNVIGSFFSALVPSKKKIISEHPELEGKSGEINKYRIKRIVNFAEKKGKMNVLQSTGKRNKLLKELKIIK